MIVPPNPAVQPTATSHGLRQEVSGDSTTPSHWLLSHPVRRRSALVLSVFVCQVAVAELLR
jgi:hypothetical protein